MTRTMPFAGLATAALCAAVGALLLVTPSAPSAPFAAERVAPVDEVAPEALVPPDDRPVRAPSALPDGAPAALAEGTRIRVPRLRIDLPIEPGDLARDVDRQATPTGAAFLSPGTAVPGTAGNAYIYAHARPGMFLALWGVRLGDVVEVGGPAGRVLRYAVTEIHPRVDPSDLSYLAATGDERLTLQTSTGPWPLSPRFVVVARPLR